MKNISQNSQYSHDGNNSNSTSQEKNIEFRKNLSIISDLISALEYRQYNEDEEKKILQNLLKTGYLEIVKDKKLIDRYY